MRVFCCEGSVWWGSKVRTTPHHGNNHSCCLDVLVSFIDESGIIFCDMGVLVISM